MRILPCVLALACLLTAPLAFAQPAPGVCVENLTIISDHDRRIVTLMWDATPGATSYHVERTLDGGEPEIIATLPSSETSFVDSPAPEGILDYRVAANGPPTPECPMVSVHIGGEPTPPGEQACVGGLGAQARADGSIRLTWPALTGAESYDILRAEGNGPLVPHAVRSFDVTEFIDTATTPGVSYTYAVSANGLPDPGERCEEITVVAVPFFPGFVAILATAGVGVAALVTMRRR